MLKINNLSCLKGKKEILKSLSFNISKTRATLLLGKSGSGKTTLLRCIAQLESEYQGEISYKGQPINKLSPKKRSQTIGFISQSFALFPHMNILDNCAKALAILYKLSKEEAYAQTKETLRLLDIENLALSMPSQLSGGQQQRAAIARALVLKPSFLLFDEPTSALDPENTKRFMQIVRDLLAAKTGVIIASHDMQFASQFLDAVYFLEEGKFVESYDAAKEEVIPREGKIHRFLSMN
ncbi:MAG TPA: hypothetical protein DCE71_06265 [Parachlamydiales bacterium]|nr:hypothetical protein [Parachlamydiales bacterium]